MAANKIYIQVDFQSDAANQAISSLNKNIGGISSAANTATKTATVGISGFTSALLKTTAGAIGLVTSVEAAGSAIASFAIDAIKGAIEAEQLEKSNTALAVAMGYTADAAENLRKKIGSLGVSNAEAAKLANQALQFGISPQQEQALAQFAKTLQSINGLEVAANLEALNQAVESGSSKSLRAIALNVDLEAALEKRAYQTHRLVSELSDQEVREIRIAEILKDRKIQEAAAAAATDTAAEKLRTYKKAIDDLKDSIGKTLKDEGQNFLTWLGNVALKSKEIADHLRDIPIIKQFRETTDKYVTDPSRLPGGGTGVGRFFKAPEPKVGQPGATPGSQVPPPPPPPPPPPDNTEYYRRLRANDVRVTEALIRGQEQYQEALKATALVQASIVKSKNDEAQQIADNATSSVRAAEALKELNDGFYKSIESRLTLSDRELADEREKLTHYTNELGKRKEILFTKEEEKKLEDYLTKKATERTQAIISENAEERRQSLQRFAAARAEANRARIVTAEAFQRGIQEKTADERLSAARELADQRTQIELAQLDAVEAVTVKEKIALEQKKTVIQAQGIAARTQLEITQIEVETGRAVAAKYRELDFVKNITAKQIRDNEAEAQQIRDRGDEQKRIAQEKSNVATEAAAAESAATQQRVIVESYRQTFDTIKTFTGELFDAFTDKSQSVFKAIADVFKRTFLSVMRDIVTSQVAGALYALLGFGTARYNGPGQPSTITPRAGGGGANLWSLLTGGGGGGGGGDWTVANLAAASAVAGTGGGFGSLALPTGYVGSGGGSANREAPSASILDDLWSLPQTRHWKDISLAPLGGGSTTAGSTQAKQLTNIQQLKNSLNIGKPVTIQTGTGVQTLPWSQAPASARLAAVLKSPGAAQLGFGLASSLALGGFSKGTTGGLIQGVASSTLAGVAAASLFPALGLTYLGGGLLGAGVGLAAAGLIRGGKSGLALSIGGGALTGAILGTAVFPGLGTLAGAAIGAAVGGIAGLIRLVSPGQDQMVRSKVKQVYGIDITEKNIRQQIIDIAKQRYGGNLDVAIRSQEVQELVRLYSLTTGQTAGLPRPIYPASFAQSGAGGLQLQPVYSSGQLVASPYSGTTTTQLAQAGLYVQLNPATATQLFSGQVVNVLQKNPATVAQANAAATRSGNSRDAQRTALMEPLTVTR